MRKLKVLYNVASLGFAAILLLGAIGCDEADTDNDVTPTQCDPAECTEIPDSFCEGDDLVVYTAGCNDENECEYTATTTTCDHGCEDDACAPEPDVEVDLCEDVKCDSPPKTTCDNTMVVSYTDGVCDSETGECDYTEVRTDCADDGQTCDKGKCVDIPLCDDVVCDTPPEATCENNLRVTYEETGHCIPATGQCRYQEITENCAAQSMICEAGACVDLCEDVTCNEPGAPYCSENGNAVTLREEGTCQWETGECLYMPASEHDCSALQQVCTDGACVDLCPTNACSTPPDNYCDGQGKAVVYSPHGSCEWRTGQCTYSSRSTNCRDYRQVCSAGTCLDMCEDTVCDAPPADNCVNDTLVSFNQIGQCNWETGFCSYTQTDTDCTTDLMVCEDAACVDRCADVPCDDPGPDYCYDNIAITLETQGTCDWRTGLCSYDEADRTDCTDTNTICHDGVCSDNCADVVCDAPVDRPYCDGNTLVTYVVPGDCDWTTGECVYDTDTEDCEDFMMVCVDGDEETDATCLDLCEFEDCVQDRGEPYCDGNLLSTTSPLGTCEWETGECVYPIDTYDCGEDEMVCDADIMDCVDLCDQVECNDTPNLVCADEDTLTTYQTYCQWETGECQYDPVYIDCEDEVYGDYCDGNTAVVFTYLGCVTYEEGDPENPEFHAMCDFEDERIDCADFDNICLGGVCYGVEPCTPCQEDAECGGDKDLCVHLLDGLFCAPDCAETGVCPDGYSCVLVDEGTDAMVCLPDREYCEDVDCTEDTDCDHPVCSHWDVCQPGYNLDFEDWDRGTPPRGFAKDNTPTVWTIEQETEIVNTGSSAAVIDAMGSALSTDRNLATTPYYYLPVSPEVDYTFHVWYNYTRPDEEARSFRIGMSFLQEDKNTRAGDARNSAAVSTNSNGWKELVYTTNSHADAAWLKLWYRSKGTLSYTDDWAVTVAKSFDLTDGVLDEGTYQIATGANGNGTLNVALNNEGVLYVATDKASYSNGSDRMVFMWLNGSSYAPTALPWQKTGVFPGAKANTGSSFVLLQRESQDGVFTCQWQKQTDLGWLAIDEEVACGDGANGQLLEGTINLPQILELTDHYGSTFASIPAMFNFAAYDVDTANNGRLMSTGAIPADSLTFDEETGDVSGINFDATANAHRVKFLAGRIY